MSRKKPSKYPWNTWERILKEEGVLYLDQNIDFDTPIRYMRDRVRTHFRKQEIFLSISSNDETLKIIQIEIQEPRTRYPWELWLNGESHVLKEGVDFNISPTFLRKTARNHTKYSVSLKEDPFTREFTICALPNLRSKFNSQHQDTDRANQD